MVYPTIAGSSASGFTTTMLVGGGAESAARAGTPENRAGMMVSMWIVFIEVV